MERWQPVLAELRDQAGQLFARLAALVQELARPALWDRDIVAELAYNPGPYANAWLRRDGGWWPRARGQITALTLHHTLSDSPHATAAYCVTKDGGLPSIQYHFWITQTGEVLLTAPLEWGLWHDSTGHENRAVSIGLAGRLHEYAPADAQLQAAARLVAGLQAELGGDTLRGHNETAATTCPGWDCAASGKWRARFLAYLAEAQKLHSVRAMFVDGGVEWT